MYLERSSHAAPAPPPLSIWKSYTYRVIFYRAKSKRYYYTIKHVYYIKMYILITVLGHLSFSPLTYNEEVTKFT